LSYQQLNCFCKAKKAKKLGVQYWRSIWRSGSLAHPVFALKPTLFFIAWCTSYSVALFYSIWKLNKRSCFNLLQWQPSEKDYTNAKVNLLVKSTSMVNFTNVIVQATFLYESQLFCTNSLALYSFGQREIGRKKLLIYVGEINYRKDRGR
jgi:hypothetical protein